MEILWPATLPDYVSQEQYSETIQDPVIRTEMDAGPRKARLRYTRVPEVFTVALVLTKAQMGTFEVFFRNHISYGALPFIWKHPRLQTDAECKITGPYTAVPHGLDFIVSFTMEI